MVLEFLGFIPAEFRVLLYNLALALLYLVVAFIAAKIVSAVVYRLRFLDGLEKRIEKNASTRIKITHIIAIALNAIIYLIAIEAAFTQLGLIGAAAIVSAILAFIPNILAAIIIIIGGYALASTLSKKIDELNIDYAEILSKIIFSIIVYISLAIALPIIRINIDFLNSIFLIIVASLGLGIAIALGLGLKDIVDEKAREYLKSKKK
ncbi:MAG: hypothetical protein V1494_02985 [Candidatus Diapherotrites archaeon]